MLCFPLDVAVRGKTLLKLVFYITSVLICVSYLKKKSKITFSTSLSSRSKYTQIEHMCLEISFYFLVANLRNCCLKEKIVIFFLCIVSDFSGINCVFHVS